MVIPFPTPQSLSSKSYENNYDFCCRVTKSELINKFAQQIKKSQATYENSLNDELNKLIRNIQICEKVDNILGKTNLFSFIFKSIKITFLLTLSLYSRSKCSF